MKIKKINEEVYYPEEEIVSVSAEDIEKLKKIASANVRKRARICTHVSIEDSIHEMLIVHTKDAYVRPHKHLSKIESFHVIEGEADIVIFNEDGDILKIINIGDYRSQKVFYYRLGTSVYHTLNIKSDFIVFHETTNGPFNPQDTIFPLWAPEEYDEDGIKRHLIKINSFIR